MKSALFQKTGSRKTSWFAQKKKLIGSEAIRNQSNSAFATSVAIDELVGLGFDNYKRRKEQIEAVTLDPRFAAWRQYFATPSRVEVIVRPPEKTAANSILSPQSDMAGKHLHTIWRVIPEIYRICHDAGAAGVAIPGPAT